ncbi:dipeptide/oligopeptide/nickel ABC transporter permease/ATP-binding protein [Nonomuraea sediminis]|uniref:dipeptide/oligopeptide/nickel ABC transporter permease/ATP-binding protein n=1 Tax=Nonomuraea sediminis TaxID=2835864 RepID=UPI001BDBF0D7|nr:dipeptide/oligopeptide/nickel ABC transporter permease/ATP-binding protein [Nonomuraea sediminis]
MRRHRHTTLGAIAVIALSLLLAAAVLGPLLWGAAAARVDMDAALRAAQSGHAFGTDDLGRDVLARVMVATRLSIGLALLATLISVALGALAGGLPAVLGVRAARLVTAAIDLAMTFPGLLLVLVLAVIFGAGATGAVLAVGVAGAPSFARLTRNLAATVAAKDYVAAARLFRVGRGRLLARHILPNIAEPLVVNATIGAGQALLAFAGLSFLGLGVQSPAYDWGRLLNEGLNNIYVNPSAALAPAAAIVFAGITFSLVGEALAQILGVRRSLARPPRPVDSPGSEASEDAPESVVSVADLTVAVPGDGSYITVVDGISLEIGPGERVGLVGESGSGKSLTALAVAGLLGATAHVRAGRLLVAGTDLLAMTGRRRRRSLGSSVSMVFQDPLTSLNPALRIGAQLAEVSRVHHGLPRASALGRAVDRLRSVHIPAPHHRVRQYPHELSGGMRQRVMIAMGLMGEPEVVIADEPTTALDVSVQRRILRLLRELSSGSGAALLLISHDMAAIAGACDRVLVMYCGSVVEDLPVDRLTTSALHPYTRALVAAVPTMATARDLPLATIPGRQPHPRERPAGCAFAARCAHADERCRHERPVLTPQADHHLVACWHPRHPEDEA